MNDDEQVDRIGNHLEGKRVALCVSGGIAAIETPKVARMMRRYGATVDAYMTQDALKFVGRAALEWATGRSVVAELSGLAEHICRQDIVVVAPATLNTINKVMAGVADNQVTALVASALGSNIPVRLAPTMHESLWKNPMFQYNVGLIQRQGSGKDKAYDMRIIKPRMGEGKAKMPSVDTIVAETCRTLSVHPIRGKIILVTAGPTPGKIDDVRQITNIFKGTLGVKIAQEAYLRGAHVTLLLGPTGIKVPGYIDTQVHHDYDEYRNNVLNELGINGADAGIFSAAVADYIPAAPVKGKIPSGGALKTIELRPTAKVIDEVRQADPRLYMVTFKYVLGMSKHELWQLAADRVRNKGYQVVVANRGEEVDDKNHKAYIVTKDGLVATPQTKDEIATTLVDLVGKALA